MPASDNGTASLPGAESLGHGQGPVEVRMTELFAMVYDQLRASAQKLLASERPGQTLQATALVHEAYLKLSGPRDVPWSNRAHFYAAAAQAMRQILIDHARSRAGRLSRAEARARALKLSGIGFEGEHMDLDGLLALDEVLARLEGADPQAAAVVRLRFFAGLGIDQTAETLGVSPRTVKRDWAFARGWLRQALEAEAP
jgi:RNA polymerase sigma factor (TIGR02999 family)